MAKKEKEKILKNAVLVFLFSDTYKKVLLALKTKKIGKGRLNGYGGGIKKGETARKAAAREIEEETRPTPKGRGIIVDPKRLKKVAIMHFHNITENGEPFVCKVHVFLADKWAGKIVETKDMAEPQFYHIDDLPLKRMCPADRFWFPLIFRGKPFVGFAKQKGRQTILIGRPKINYVDCLSEE